MYLSKHKLTCKKLNLFTVNFTDNICESGCCFSEEYWVGRLPSYTYTVRVDESVNYFQKIISIFFYYTEKISSKKITRVDIWYPNKLRREKKKDRKLSLFQYWTHHFPFPFKTNNLNVISFTFFFSGLYFSYSSDIWLKM